MTVRQILFLNTGKRDLISFTFGHQAQYEFRFVH